MLLNSYLYVGYGKFNYSFTLGSILINERFEGYAANFTLKRFQRHFLSVNDVVGSK